METLKQKLLMSYLIANPDLFAVCNSIIRPSYFDPTIKKAVEFSQHYFEKYKQPPSPEQVLAETGIIIETKELTKAEYHYAADEVETFCRNKAVEAAILQSPALLDKQDFGTIINSLKNAISIGLTKDLGVDYFENPELRLKDLLNNSSTYSTGWSEADDLLGGGVSRQELFMFMANSGVGKSVVMSNLAFNLMAQGLNVIYFTMELADKIVAKRFDSMFTGISQGELLKNIEIASQKVMKAGERTGKLFIKRMPEGTTNSNHMRAYLKEFEQIHGFIPDVIISDYLDLMAMNSNMTTDNMFTKDKFVAEEFRALGFEFDAIMVSASQMGRNALEAENHHQGHIQGGMSKVNTADALIAIVQSEMMRAAGEYMFEFIKTRNSNGVGKKVILRWDPIALRVTDLNKDGLMLKTKAKKTEAVAMGTGGMVFDSAKPPSSNPLLDLMKTGK